MRDTRDSTIDVYRRILAIVFNRLAPTFGHRTIAAIAKNAAARQAREHPILAHLKFSEAGADWTAFEASLGGASVEEIATSLDSFVDEFFEALSSLIGRLIVGKLFQEAEELAKEGDEA